ncbi:MAG: phenylalanine--tRNA ligase subunit alpha [Candidatus Pacebacteria bacterium]|nr:phenylalanine--tRNA ligase subunit alpha [Candidatus Paceibacterota bacterium]
MKNKINDIKNKAIEEIKKAKTFTEVETLRVKYSGRKSELTNVLRGLKDLSSEEKKEIGELSNMTKQTIDSELAKKELEIKNEELNNIDEKERIDITYPGEKSEKGHLHPLTKVRYDIEEIFKSMGFLVVEDREVEDEFHNFDAMNMPKNHPARDMQDTFWLKNGCVPRTHTSSVQARFMEKNKPPFKIISLGRVYRNENSDATHESNFHQVEGLIAAKSGDVTVANAKSIISEFMKGLFGEETKIRLRPSYFPFVEPGFEFDASCPYCKGEGCRICKKCGWIELGGAGMVNQNVFEKVRFTEDEFEGFAFGFGIERLAMIKYGIDDIRLFHAGDLRFLEQF